MPKLKKIKILHILIALAAFSFVVRLSNIVATDATQNQTILAARAVEDSKDTPPPMTDADKNTAQDQEASPTEDAPEEEGFVDIQTDFSDSEVELLQALAARREELRKREDTLKKREALLKVAEQQVDRKVEELKKLRSEMEALLDKQQTEQDGRIKSLVKIYESMKPKQAAEIFNTLEMDVLLAVLGRMSERRSAPIIAGMMPERAREITIKLAEQKQLPTLPE